MKLRDHINMVLIGLCLAGFALSRAGLSPTSATVAPRPSPPHPATFDPARALATVHHLCTAIGPRPSGSEGERRAAAFLAQRLRALGYQVTVQQGINLGPTRLTTCNVIARLIRDPGAPRLVLGAHMDCVRGAGCVGANDNASGVAVLLELARVQAKKPLPCTLEIVFFGGEEQFGNHGWGYGSKGYVRAGLAGGKRPVVGMIAVDMAGRGDRLHAWRADRRTTHLHTLLNHSAARLGLTLHASGRKSTSDHKAFARAGIPSLWLQRLPDSSYHSAQDLPENLSPEALSQTGRLLCHLLQSLRPDDVRLLARQAGVALPPAP